MAELKIKYCEFDPIAFCLRAYGNVISLDISNSGYDSIDSFELNHNFLKKLNASHNKIVHIPHTFFVNIPEICEVDFSYCNNCNKLFHIESVTFEGANNLSTINLSHNYIRLTFKGYNEINNIFKHNTKFCI